MTTATQKYDLRSYRRAVVKVRKALIDIEHHPFYSRGAPYHAAMPHIMNQLDRVSSARKFTKVQEYIIAAFDPKKTHRQMMYDLVFAGAVMSIFLYMGVM